MTTEQLTKIVARMGLKPSQQTFLAERLAMGRCFIVTRPCGGGRTIQGSCETQENAMKTYNGWIAHQPILHHVTDGGVVTILAYHTRKKRTAARA